MTSFCRGTVAVIFLGMGGLYFNIEYSGWVVFCGCVMCLFINEK